MARATESKPRIERYLENLGVARSYEARVFERARLPRYPADAPTGARVLNATRHIVELASPRVKGQPSVYLGLFVIEEGPDGGAR